MELEQTLENIEEIELAREREAIEDAIDLECEYYSHIGDPIDRRWIARKYISDYEYDCDDYDYDR